MRWLDDGMHFRIFLLFDWKSRYFDLHYLFKAKKKKNYISIGPSFMFGIIATFWKLTNVIWKFNCITLISIKCQMSSTAKLIPLRLKTMVLHLEWASQASLAHQHSGESAGLLDLKPSKQLIALEILLSALTSWRTDSSWDSSSVDPEEDLSSPLDGSSQPVCSNTFKPMGRQGFH